MSKVILITGASSGMGKDSAIKLIKEGHKVYTAARRIEKTLFYTVVTLQAHSLAGR
jgi:NADP-dependent 3-hydroxy acid dehydrogenase YdfG